MPGALGDQSFGYSELWVLGAFGCLELWVLGALSTRDFG